MISTPPNIVIKALSEKYDFLACGIAQANPLTQSKFELQNWLELGYHGNMAYMANHFEKRIDPTLLVEGAKSVICFAFNYFPQNIESRQNTINQSTNLPNIKKQPLIAKYAWGDDYHLVIKEKLQSLISDLKLHFPNFDGRAFVDSAPVMERQWAERAGLGWIGKNSLLLRKGVGSFFFLAEIICNLDLEADTPQTDHCGSCTACIDACPTNAIVQPQLIDSRLCLSHATIEDKQWPVESAQATNSTNTIINNTAAITATSNSAENQPNQDPITTAVKDTQWAYGCDICQDVCPWNRFSEPHSEPRFSPREFIHWDAKTWQNELKSPARLKAELKNTALQRTGFSKLAKQISLVIEQRSDNQINQQSEDQL